MTPQYGTMDVGAYGKALHIAGKADSIISVLQGPAGARTVVFAFPGFSGGFAHNLGRNVQPIVWTVTIRADSLDTLMTIEDNIKAALTAGEQTMTLSTGRQVPRVVLLHHKAAPGFNTIRGGDTDGWIRREDKLEFVSLAS